MMSVVTKRVHEQAEKTGGTRFLVERLWPRGTKKELLGMRAWLKGVAPSDALPRWFAHDRRKWAEFQRQYAKELDAHPKAWQPLFEATRKGNITLLDSARDTEHNNAAALQSYLKRKLNKR